LRKLLRIMEDSGTIQSSFDALTKANDNVRAAVMTGEGARAHSIFVEESTPAFQMLLKAIREQQQQFQKKRDVEASREASRLRITETILIISVSLLVVLITLIGVMLTRSISGALSRIVEKVRIVASGDLRVSLAAATPPTRRSRLSTARSTTCSRTCATSRGAWPLHFRNWSKPSAM